MRLRINQPSRHLAEQDCSGFDEAAQQRVAAYVQVKYKIPTTTELMLKENMVLPGSCLRRLTFESATQKRVVTLYLSPDQRYIAPLVYDLSEDPTLEEKTRLIQLMKSLIAEESPSLGNPTAPIIIVVFSDFQCPYCKRLADMLKKDYLPANLDNTRIIYKNFPLPMHPWAKEAAETAVCAGFQKREAFWKVHDFLYANQSALTPSTITERVAGFVGTLAGMDVHQLRNCVKNEMALGIIMRDSQLARTLGVTSTPTIYINGVEAKGVQSARELEDWIRRTNPVSIPPSSIPVALPSKQPTERPNR